MNQQHELEEDYTGGSLRDRMPTLEGARVRWGRVVVLVFLVGWAFVLGRCSAPDGVPTESFRRVNQELNETRTELQRARERQANPSPAPGPANTSSPSPTPSPTPTIQTHVVKSGETLRGISLRYYKTPNLANFIAEENNVDSGSLKIGQQLTIPPKPEDP